MTGIYTSVYILKIITFMCRGQSACFYGYKRNKAVSILATKTNRSSYIQITTMEKSEHYLSQNSLYDAIDQSRAIMTDKDKHIYNLLQRSAIKKVLYGISCMEW